VGDSCLYIVVCRLRPEHWVRVGYKKLCVNRDQKYGLQLVT